MKKYSVLKIILYIILIMNITFIALSGTYAKYTSTGQTEIAYATVASWKVLINDYDIATGTEVLEFNLFDKIYDSDNYNYEEDIEGALEYNDNTHSGGSNDSLSGQDSYATIITPASNIVAPGTSGKFAMTIENASNVNVIYGIEFTEYNDYNVPIEYSIDNTNFYTADDLATLINDSAEKIQYDDSTVLNIYWRWQFEGDGTNNYSQTDETDNVLGTSTEEIKYQIVAKLIVTQVD